MREPLTEELAYLAGIVDGEGCVGAYSTSGTRPKRASFRFSVCVAMCERAALDLFVELYGGAVRSSMRGGRRRPIFSWTVYADRAAAVASDVLPYLRVKRGQAEALIEARNTVNGVYAKGVSGMKPATDQDYALRDICRRRIVQLNQHLVENI
jgi:hypothetical protein